MLIKKSHFYELLDSFQLSIDNIISVTPTAAANETADSELWNEEKPSEEKMEYEEEQDDNGVQKKKDINFSSTSSKAQSLSSELVKTTVHLLSEIYKVLKGVETELSLLPPKAFPGQNMPIDKSSEDAFVGVARMLKHK